MSKLHEQYSRDTEGKESSYGMVDLHFVAWLERRAERWEAVAGRLAEASKLAKRWLTWDALDACKAALAEHEAAKGD